MVLDLPASIESSLVDKGTIPTNDYGLRKVLEYFMGQLRTSQATTHHAVDEVMIDRYRFDLNSYLALLGLDESMFWVTMRLNNMTSPMDFDYNHNVLLIPSADEVKLIVMTYHTSRRLGAKKK